MVNSEPRVTKTPAMQKITIVTWGGKKTGEDAREKEPIRGIRSASPKQMIRPKAQKKYFQEAVETFARLGGDKGLEIPMTNDTGEKSATGALIEEWLHLFLNIVDNDSI